MSEKRNHRRRNRSRHPFVVKCPDARWIGLKTKCNSSCYWCDRLRSYKSRRQQPQSP